MALICDDPYLPVLPVDLCSVDLKRSQIDMILFTVYGKGFATFPSSTDWNDRYSNTDLLPTTVGAPLADFPIRGLHVIGTKKATEYDEKEISLGRKVRTIKLTEVEFEVDDVSLNLYVMLQEMQTKNAFNVTAWYATRDDVFGGKGIAAQLTMDFEISNNRTDSYKIKGKLSWKSGDPTMTPLETGLLFRDGIEA